jgi:hypothetical protein
MLVIALGGCLTALSPGGITQTLNAAEGQAPPPKEADANNPPGAAESKQNSESAQSDSNGGPALDSTAPGHTNNSINPRTANQKPKNGYRYPNCPYEDVDECDLLAQQDMAQSTREMSIAAWVSVILSLIAVGLIWFTMRYTAAAAEYAREAAKGTNEAVTVARQTLIASQRPWLSVTVHLVSDLHIADRQGRIDVHFEVQNHGHSPATGVYIEPAFIDMFPITDASKEERDHLLDNAKSGSAQKHGLIGQQIFPRNTIKTVRTMHLRKNERPGFLSEANNYFNPTLIIFVSYASTLDDKILITEMRKSLWQSRDDAPHLSGSISTEDQIVPRGKLMLTSDSGDGKLY